MKSFLKLAVWILVLLGFSFIAGTMAILNTAPYTPRNEYLFVAIIGPTITILLLGSISFIVYRVLKKKGSPLAQKRALQWYSVLVFMLAFTGIFQFKSTLQKRDKVEFLEQFKPFLTAFVYGKIDDSQYQNIDEDALAENADNYIRCITMELEYSKPDLLNRLMTAENKKDFLQKDTEFKEVEQRCMNVVTNAE